MKWDGRFWNVYFEDDDSADYILWISSSARDAVLPGNHRWSFYDKSGTMTHDSTFITQQIEP
jgi:hypothetical protein